MSKVELEIKVASVDLGIKEGSKPEEDRHQYLEIDELEVKQLEGRLFITPKKWHIKEYPVDYCVDCLAEGKRNKDVYFGTCSKTEHWFRCKDHYAKFMRGKDPEHKCPKCDVGYLHECGVEGEDLCCTHCDYRKNVRPTYVFIEQLGTMNSGKEEKKPLRRK
jgi:hypothetical protein